MKAIIWTHYSTPENSLELQEVEKPTPKDNQVLIKVHASTVTQGDCEFRKIKFPLWIAVPLRIYSGMRKPTRIPILGTEVSGVVESIGKDVTRFKVGDAVFGSTGFTFGAYAEYNCLDENAAIAIKPENMSFEEAATVATGGLESVHFLRLANLQPGQHILINGAGGSIGTYGLQLAKNHYGAKVSAVDSAEKLDMLRELGADHVFDYRTQDFSKSGQQYDVVFDVIGKGFSRGVRSLKPGGVFLMANPKMIPMLGGVWTKLTSNKKVIMKTNDQSIDDLLFLKAQIEAGKIKAIVDRVYPLEQTADAHRYVETGAKAGNVVISVAD